MQRIWNAIERGCGAVAMFALRSLVVLPFLQVILRDVFNSPLIGLEEGTRWGLIGLVFLGLPLLVGRDAQIRFPELVALLPLPLRLVLERITLLAGAAALGTLLWAALNSIMLNSSTRTPTLDIPFWLFALPFLVGLALTTIGCLWIALRRTAPPIDGGAPTL